jgi:hypothetical protein
MSTFLRCLVAGAAGGAAGLRAMRFYWRVVEEMGDGDTRPAANASNPNAEVRQPAAAAREATADVLDDIAVRDPFPDTDEPSTAQVGRRVYEEATGQPPPTDEMVERMSQRVHQGVGLTAGSLYGLLRGSSPVLDPKGGLTYGALMWLVGDELAVPMLGLAKGPTAYPARHHLHRLGAHVAYGVAMSMTTQILKRILRAL